MTYLFSLAFSLSHVSESTTYTVSMTFSGAVLAGGRSSRFGSDKARFVLESKPLLAWVLESFAAAEQTFIVAGRDYGEFGVPVFEDLSRVQTPLSGLHSALVHASCEWVAVAACDLPFLTPQYWAILNTHREGVRAVVVRREGRLEPLAALYHRDLADRVFSRLQQGDLAVHKFVQALAPTETRVLPLERLALPRRTLTNVNTRGDLKAIVLSDD